MATVATRRCLIGVGPITTTMLPLLSAMHVEEAPLSSRNDGAVKQAVLDCAVKVMPENGLGIMRLQDRIAVFDNDGTFWSEQPGYLRAAFVVDHVRAPAPRHPEWRHQQPFAAALCGDTGAPAASGEAGIFALTMAIHASMTIDETDDVREVVYDRKSAVGRLDKALDAAPRAGWTVVDMRVDQRRMHAFES